MDLDAVADELYALPPGSFVATRTARAREAKEAGDGELAARIRSLGKPNQVAWLANRLARDHADEVARLVDLGDALREATAGRDGERLRELSRQQHQLIRALVRQAIEPAGAAGRRVSDATARGLETTLHAALADERAAAELVAGRLSTGLSQSGFGLAGAPPGGSHRPARPARAARAADPVTDGSPPAAGSEALIRAEQTVAAAATVDRDAARALDAAQREAAAAEERATVAAATVDRLRADLREATGLQAEAERAQRTTRTSLDRAERAARTARQRLTTATDRRDRLTAN